MLFTAINRLRGQYKTIGLAIAFTGENEISVLVTPTLKPEVVQSAPHLANPFVVKGTAAEMDAGFEATFERFAASLKGLEEQTQAQIDAAAAATKASAQIKKSGKPVGGTDKRESASQLADLINTGTPAGEDDEKPGGDAAGGSEPKISESALPAVQTADTLF